MDGRLDSVGILTSFFSRVESNDLFTDSDPESYTVLRQKLKQALVNALVWERPKLEQSCGIMWPYEGLRQITPMIQANTRNTDSRIRLQARLFLSLLPFPGQWRYLDECEDDLFMNPEIKAFLKKESETVLKKITKKKQKKFKLRHFCQILKRPALPNSKGILRIFSIPYLFFLMPGLLNEISKQYVLYVEPAAGVVFRHTWMRVFSGLEDPVMFGLSSREDALFHENQSGIVTTSLAHGDYLEAGDPPLVGLDKKYDIVFNATFDEMERKRHFAMLDLMNNPRLKNLTALFLGRGNDENVGKFKKAVMEKGLANRVDLFANLRRTDIPEKLAHCKIGVHLALHENGCRAVPEYFKADIPCVVSSSMAGINMETINHKTGSAVPDDRLAEEIVKVLANREGFAPREWFLTESGSKNASEKLNIIFKEMFIKAGYSWDEDIVPLTSSGASRYADPDHYLSFKPEFKSLYKLFSSFSDLPITLCDVS